MRYFRKISVLLLALILLLPVQGVRAAGVAEIFSVDAGSEQTDTTLPLVKGQSERPLFIYFESADPSAVKVSSSGQIKGNKVTTEPVRIRARYVATNRTFLYWDITVVSGKTNTIQNGRAITIRKGKTARLLTWKSENVAPKGAVKVNASGTISAKKNTTGVATVTATELSGDTAVAYLVTVQTPKLSRSRLTLKTGGTEKLSISGAVSLQDDVTWTSAKPEVASVDENGQITAHAAGSATVSTIINGKKYSCKVTVKSPKYELNKKELYLAVGKSANLSVSGISTKKLTFASSDSSAVTVDKKGTVKAIASTSDPVTITVMDAGAKTENLFCTVYVEAPTFRAEGVPNALDGIEVALENDSRISVSGSASAPVWTSKKTAIVTVTVDGVVHGKKLGKTSIQAKIGGQNYVVPVSVVAVPMPEEDIEEPENTEITETESTESESTENIEETEASESEEPNDQTENENSDSNDANSGNTGGNSSGGSSNGGSSGSSSGGGSGGSGGNSTTVTPYVDGYTTAIPSDYYSTMSADSQGSLEWFSYEADGSIYGRSGSLTKYACVYLPAGYDENDIATKYDIVYLMHGWTGYAGEFFDNPAGAGRDTNISAMYSPTNLKNVIDHMIANKELAPVIIVTPTFYPDSSKNYMARDAFHTEFANYLAPVLETKYHTYANLAESMTTNEKSEALKASRAHRAFGGFSYGSWATWHEFNYNLEYFRYFLPISGANYRASALADAANQSLAKNRDFFIYAATGTNDSVRGQMENIMPTLKTTYGSTFTNDRLVYYLRQGGLHDLNTVRECLYNGLPTFFPSASAEFTTETKIAEVKADPAFVTSSGRSYGELLFPVNSGYYSGETLGDLRLTWYSNIDTNMTVEICNTLRSRAARGETVFYDIYSDAEKAADPAKKDTGLFFFGSEATRGKKVAICNAGGGFAYVGAMHDSFPHALQLSKKGYNAFALIYRPGADTACEDLARAIAFLLAHEDELGIDMTDYSLWGGSAGARMATWLGSYGTESFGEESYPRPAAVIMQYTGLSEVTGSEPPTYACVGTSDGIASYRTMENRINAIKANGTDAEIEVFEGLSHGFGLGTGTVAEGWLDHAVEFWERNQ